METKDIEQRLERIERILVIGAKEALTAAEAALFIGISESRVRHLASEKELPYYKQGKNTYFRKSEIERWMLKERVQPNSEFRAEATTYVTLNRPKLQVRER